VSGNGGSLEIRRLTPELSAPAVALLEAVAAEPDGRFFTPHPFSREFVDGLAASPGRDAYHLLMSGNQALAYGLLRGWNEGYPSPSLGLAVSPAARGAGLGRLMMEFLHAEARFRGADRIRLRVHLENQKAIALYRRMGYSFDAADAANGLVVGWKNLVTR
jgi:ribosomal protein S18 acetylase RimI-like enzyme